eukprot:UN33939
MEKRSTEFDSVLREITIMKKIKHPNIVMLHEVLDDPKNNELFLVMEFVSGGTIVEIKDSGGYGTIKDMNKLRGCVHDIIRGLEYLHLHHIFHSDIKPDNMLLDKKTQQVKLADFGTSKFIESEKANACRGTSAYIPPETEQDEFGWREVDLWAVGVSLFAIYYGQTPWYCNSYEIHDMIKEKPLEFPSELDPDLKHLIERLLDKVPSTRMTLEQMKVDKWFGN